MIRQKAAYYDQNKVSCPVTVRTLETLIRIATAHAKLKLNKSVSTNDIDVAVSMIHLSIFGTEMDDGDDDDQAMEDEENIKSATQKNQKVVTRRDKGEAVDENTQPNGQNKRKRRVQFDEEEDDDDEEYVGGKGMQGKVY